MRPSPRRGGGNLCARNWVGFGLPRPWRDGGQIRRRPSRVGAPHGANYDAYATLTGPTLRANLPPRRGGATIPYIYKGIVRSYAFFLYIGKTRTLHSFGDIVRRVFDSPPILEIDQRSIDKRLGCGGKKFDIQITFGIAVITSLLSYLPENISPFFIVSIVEKSWL